MLGGAVCMVCTPTSSGPICRRDLTPSLFQQWNASSALAWCIVSTSSLDPPFGFTDPPCSPIMWCLEVLLEAWAMMEIKWCTFPRIRHSTCRLSSCTCYHVVVPRVEKQTAFISLCFTRSTLYGTSPRPLSHLGTLQGINFISFAVFILSLLSFHRASRF